MGYTITEENICHKAATLEVINDFMGFFEKANYPPLLRKMKLQVILGTGLEC